LLTFVLLFTLTGCGGPSAPTLSTTHTKAIEYNQSGTKALEKGDYEKALAYYLEALKINRSIENTEGIAVNLINIAVVYQKKGNPEKAHEFIELAVSMPDISSSVKSDAAYEKARLYLKQKNTVKAGEWVNRALSFNKGLLEGSRWNLIGRIAFAEGKYEEALLAANTALKLNVENKQKAEEANSLRLIAEIKARKGVYPEAKAYYIKALDLDKELGDSKKIALTLRGLGNLSMKQAHFQDAVMFYMRAYDVSSNAGDMEGIVQALDSLADAYRKSGNDKKAGEMIQKKADMEREKKK